MAQFFRFIACDQLHGAIIKTMIKQLFVMQRRRRPRQLQNAPKKLCIVSSYDLFIDCLSRTLSSRQHPPLRCDLKMFLCSPRENTL